MKHIPVTLHGTQQPFFTHGPAPHMLMGGVGCGKSYVGILKMLKLLDLYPGSRGVIIRQRFSQLKKTTAATLWKLLPKDRVARRNDNEGVVYLKNGSRLDLLHLDKADSIDNLKSLEINFAYIDQAEDISVDAFDTLIERVGRWTGATMRGGYGANWPYTTEMGEKIPPPYVFISAYSPGYDHWITARFWDQGSEREHYRKMGYTVYIGSTRDNPNLTKQYIAGRLAMGKDYVDRFVDAVSWGANEGAIFEVTEQSILEPTDEVLRRIKSTMRLHRVMDHGEAVPTAVLWYATDADHNVIYYREYGEPRLLVSEHRQNVFRLSQLDFTGAEPARYHSNYADPAIFAKSRGRGVNQAPQWSVADEWAERRIVTGRTAITWRPANNNEAMTINRVREYLHPDPNHKHPFTGRMGAPRAYFLRKTAAYPLGMHETLRDLRAAKREELSVTADGTRTFGDKRDPTVRDHWLDGVRYSIGMRPALGRASEVEITNPGEVNFNRYLEQSAAMEEERTALAENLYEGASEPGF